MGFWEVTLSLIGGLKWTCLIFALTLVLALPLGLVIAFGSMSKFKPLSFVTKVFVWIIRGIPLMLQIFVVFYVPGIIFPGFRGFDRFPAVLIAFVINYACYFSEIFRGGIESISKGQYEAGQVLGMTRRQTFFRVVLLQVIKRIIPPMSNEIITLVKDTSLARTISVYEIIWNGQAFIKSDGLLWPLFYTGAFYLIFNGLLTVIFGKIEKKLDYFKS